MPTSASPLNYQEQKITTGSIGQLWANLSIPAPGSRLLLHSDGTPDGTTNPDAIGLGLTEKGAVISAKATYKQYYADEYASPIDSKMDAREMTITANLLQIFDFELLKILTAGFGTYSENTNYEQITFGIGAQVFTSLALIFPTKADPSKFAVFHLYKTLNESGLDAIEISSKNMSSAKVLFRGLDITGRVATDTVGTIWAQK